MTRAASFTTIFGAGGVTGTTPLYIIGPSVNTSTTVSEGDTQVITINAINVPNTTLYYTTNGSFTNTDLTTGATSGTVNIVNGVGTITFVFAADYTTEGQETGRISLQRTLGGADIAASGLIRVDDTSTAPKFMDWCLKISNHTSNNTPAAYGSLHYDSVTDSVIVVTYGSFVTNDANRVTVMKVNASNGSIAWSKTVSHLDVVSAAVAGTDTSGNITLTIQAMYSDGSFDNTNYSEIMILNLNPDGTYRWMRRLNGATTTTEVLGRGCIDLSGGIGVSGSVYTANTLGYSQAMTGRYNANGTFVFAHRQYLTAASSTSSKGVDSDNTSNTLIGLHQLSGISNTLHYSVESWTGDPVRSKTITITTGTNPYLNTNYPPTVDSAGATYISVTWSSDRAKNRPAVIKVAPGGSSIEWAKCFPDVNDAACVPNAPVILGSNGNIYFSTNNYVHKIASNGTLLASRTYTGSNPLPGKGMGYRQVAANGQIFTGTRYANSFYVASVKEMGSMSDTGTYALGDGSSFTWSNVAITPYSIASSLTFTDLTITTDSSNITSNTNSVIDTLNDTSNTVTYGPLDPISAYSNVVLTATLTRTFSNPNPYTGNAYDYFGQVVATNGTHVVVSAYGEYESSYSADLSGRAYIFSAANGSLLYSLRNPYPETSSYFGQPVSLQGNTLVIAASYASAYSGKVYKYDIGSLTGTAPANVNSAQLTLTNPNPVGNTWFDLFGRSVGYDNGLIVVGSSEGAATQGDYGGRVYVYDTSGILLYTLVDPNAYGAASSDEFGNAVAVSNNYIAAAAYMEGDQYYAKSGRVYIFDRNGTHLYTLDNPNIASTGDFDNFGSHLAITNDYLVVSAQGEDAPNSDLYGAVYVYQLSSFPAPAGTPVTISSPTYVLKNPGNPPNRNDYFGTAIAVDGTTVAVGAYGTGTYGANTTGGKVFLYDTRNMANANGDIMPTTAINPPTGNSGMGISVSLSGNSMAVGIYSSPSIAALYTLS